MLDVTARRSDQAANARSDHHAEPALDPVPSGATRAVLARQIRNEAATIAHQRAGPSAQRNAGETYDHGGLATFTKGLPHDRYGRVSYEHLAGFVTALNQSSANDPSASPFPGTYATGLPAPFEATLYDGPFAWPTDGEHARGWESPLAGHAFEINGPDPDRVAMPPAPAVGSDELTAEMAEVYEMALLRDVPFGKWETDAAVAQSLARLNALAFFEPDASDPDVRARRRRQARTLSGESLNAGTLFRGSTPGAQRGGYVSQFLLVGSDERRSAKAADSGTIETPNPDALNRAARFAGKWAVKAFKDEGAVEDQGGDEGVRRGAESGALAAENDVGEAGIDHSTGLIRYGAQTINQRIVPHLPGLDHMTDWTSWLDVQNGANRKGFDDYAVEARFIHTPRDLATYVHFDALYQAYLNACLIMIAQGAATDIGLPEGAGHPTRDAFATFGGPHVLTLVTEVATRALKAVRRQKYNIHLRARPEAVAGAMTLAWNGVEGADGFATMAQALDAAGILPRVRDHNVAQNADRRPGVDGEPGFPHGIAAERNALLPMAFPEGSPMHPAYGAGHATVAGACTTVLKAFFEMFDTGDTVRGTVPLGTIIAEGDREVSRWFGEELPLVGDGGLGLPAEYGTNEDGSALVEIAGSGVTIQGELDKLAANISIGRNFAGVHYHTDYYESLRMGERIAAGMLQEQMLTYREPVAMRFTSFDGDRVMITGSGGSRHGPNDEIDARIHVWSRSGAPVETHDWWNRAATEAQATEAQA